jgi:GntR family transcriptional regulator
MPPTPRRFQPGFDDLPTLPKYLRLAGWLEQRIASGDFPPESALPTEEQLCREFGVSRGTVQQAIARLVQKGLVRREQGRGSFVSPPRQPDVTSFTLLSFEEMMLRQGRTPSTRVLSAQIIPADPQAAARLAIAPETPVIQIVRLRFADGHPVSWEERLLAHDLCPDLLTHDLEHGSIHRLLIDTFRLPLVRMEQSVEIVPAPMGVAEALRVGLGTALFFVERLTYTQHAGARIPAVWFRAYHHDTTVRSVGDATMQPV